MHWLACFPILNAHNQPIAVVLNGGDSVPLGAFLKLKGALGTSKSMHYAGCYVSFRGNFVHLIVGRELLKFSEFSIFKHTLPLKRNR